MMLLYNVYYLNRQIKYKSIDDKQVAIAALLVVLLLMMLVSAIVVKTEVALHCKLEDIAQGY